MTTASAGDSRDRAQSGLTADRIKAKVVDWLISAVFAAFIGGSITLIVALTWTEEEYSRVGPKVSMILLGSAFIATPFLVFGLFEHLVGATPAKLVVGLRTQVPMTSRVAVIAGSVLRVILYGAPFLVFGGWLLAQGIALPGGPYDEGIQPVGPSAAIVLLALPYHVLDLLVMARGGSRRSITQRLTRHRIVRV